MKRRRPPSDRTSLALVPAGALSPVFDIPADLLPHAERFLRAARSSNTHHARAADWAVFQAWCEARGRTSLPAGADTVFAFLSDLAAGATGGARKPATLRRYLSTISVAHQGAGYPTPTTDARVRELMGGIRRDVGTRQRLAAPMTRDVLERVHPHCEARDWALLCFGQATACRRSELCALDLEHVHLDERGVAVTINRSKTDQEAQGRTIAVRRDPRGLCPVAALEAWLRERGLRAGPLFVGLRRGRQLGEKRLGTTDLNRIVKRAVAAAGFEAADYSAHSLRAGYVTDARRAGKSWFEIMVQTGHTELKTVKGYARYERDPFETVKE